MEQGLRTVARMRSRLVIGSAIARLSTRGVHIIRDRPVAAPTKPEGPTFVRRSLRLRSQAVQGAERAHGRGDMIGPEAAPMDVREEQSWRSRGPEHLRLATNHHSPLWDCGSGGLSGLESYARFHPFSTRSQP